MDFWLDRWEKGSIIFHNPKINEMLVKYVDKMIAGRSGIKILLPLCGKSVDMKWLYDKGHTVVGVDVASQACKAFYEESELEYTEQQLGGIKLFKSKDSRLRLYCCNLYNFSSEIEKDFDGVWDFGSFVSINKEDRAKYASLLHSLMGAECRYLLDTYDFDPEEYTGLPYFVPEEQIYELYGTKCNIERLAYEDSYSEKQRSWGTKHLNERLHLLTFK